MIFQTNRVVTRWYELEFLGYWRLANKLTEEARAIKDEINDGPRINLKVLLKIKVIYNNRDLPWPQSMPIRRRVVILDSVPCTPFACGPFIRKAKNIFRLIIIRESVINELIISRWKMNSKKADLDFGSLWRRFGGFDLSRYKWALLYLTINQFSNKFLSFDRSAFLSLWLHRAQDKLAYEKCARTLIIFRAHLVNSYRHPSVERKLIDVGIMFLPNSVSDSRWMRERIKMKSGSEG